MSKHDDDTPFAAFSSEEIRAATKLSSYSKDALQAAMERRRRLGYRTDSLPLIGNGEHTRDDEDTNPIKKIAESISSWKVVVGAVISLILAGAGGMSYLILHVASKADIVDVVKEHASHPHPLSDAEVSALAAERLAHQQELIERGELRTEVHAVAQQTDWLTKALYRSSRLNLQVDPPPPPAPKPKKEKIQ